MTTWIPRLLTLLILSAPPHAQAQVAQDRSVAVVFYGADEGGEAEVEDFTHGVLEAAGKDGAIRVLAATADSSKPDLAKIAADAKVRFVFLGEIHREDADFTVGTRLVDAQSGREVWNGRFFSDEDDLLQLPPEIDVLGRPTQGGGPLGQKLPVFRRGDHASVGTNLGHRP